ncbi:NADH:flavin oxidoreductase/NADH oxidase [Melioribacter roseus P3M-2]|uniref:NADH:flavin oxidoreductase/NADH oxidase n=1 Tax=Melioribacter roseus (strain DSM 23840 / JCM 17771 / VKM B-2668 / P3M-2) TaxID=1191523 RepID=I6ZQC1_MELRP|nr:NAD(P)/FAD-dependent oxidoreductase [Melioribacter roseus]AFN74269.1 NADH:flavin oxidoreductase/NADH oxidase [Melioribacter roseus P3M-2]
MALPKLRNRLLMSAVKTGYGDGNGSITDRHIAFWERRSPHVSAVIFEPFYIDRRVRELPTQIGIDSDDKIEGHRKLIEAVHKNGAFAVAHINHPGRMANPKLEGNIYLSASEIQCPNGGKKPKALTADEIKEVQNQYLRAALRAEKAGYDIIELQFGLGYLIAQFLSPDSNKRTDIYGGSFENRIRFGLEILRLLKENLAIPVIVRLSGDEMYEGGIKLEETIRIAKILEREKADAIHVTSGNVCMSPPWYYQHHFIPKGKNWELSKKIKEAVSIPVIAVGQINEPRDIDAILDSGSADYAAIGRALIADPDFAGKYLNLIGERIRPCSACLTGCLGRIKIGKTLQCEINPTVGRESEIITTEPSKKHYAVVGGGLAGMEAALTLEKRGHNVTLFEKENLGGQFKYAPLPPGKISLQKQIEYYIEEINDSNVSVIYKEAAPEDLIGKYDGVIIATGSKPFIPEIEGMKNYYWAEILLDPPKNKNVLIIGGGSIGVEIASALIDGNNNVTIVEMLDELARDMELITKKLNLLKLKNAGARIFTGSKVTRRLGNDVYITDNNGKETVIEEIDICVVATGMKPDTSLTEKLEGKIPYYIIGDAEKVGDAVSAIQSGYFTAKEL